MNTPVESLPKLVWIPRKATGPRSMLLENETEVESDSRPLVVWSRKRADRRHELIQKKYESFLTMEEQIELDVLQLQFGEHQDSVAPLPTN